MTRTRFMRRSLVLFALVLQAARAAAQTPASRTPDAPRLDPDDRTRLAEAFALADDVADRAWSGWSRVPFAVLLVRGDHELLLRHPRPSADFVSIGYDSVLRTEVFARPRTFAPGLLATFPAVGGISTVVVGTAAATGKRSTEWVLTLLHEHFHQLQNAQPGYFAGVESLGLARGDRTGMWMLNYPFPYDSARVQSAFAELSRAAAARDVKAARAARDRLRALVSPDDDRYLAFQLWQEGVARFAEYDVARLAATAHTPSAPFRALADYTAYDEAATALLRAIDDGARAARLGADHRVAVYPTGAAIALLLDATAPAWRKGYFERPFRLEY